MAELQYLQEIAKFQGSISVLLNYIQDLLKQLPDRRDNEDVTQKVNEILDLIKKLELETDSLSKKTICSYNDLTEAIDKLIIIEKIIKEQLNDIKISVSDSNKNEAIAFVQKVKKNYENLNLTMEGNNIEIKASDIITFFEYAKHRNKRYKFWKGTKAKFIIGMGIITSLVIGGVKFIEGIKQFLTLIGSG